MDMSDTAPGYSVRTRYIPVEVMQAADTAAGLIYMPDISCNTMLHTDVCIQVLICIYHRAAYLHLISTTG